MILLKSMLSESSTGKSIKTTAVEDLMKEHGIMRRILFIYQEIISRLSTSKDFDPKLLHQSATLIKEFVEDYHEKMEEKHIFKRLKEHKQHVECVNVLTEQHKASGRMTDKILNLSKGKIKDQVTKCDLITLLEKFSKMYAPHGSYEDTIIFPAFKKIVSSNEYDALGEEFEKSEHEKFGKEGFKGIVAEVEGIEKSLGIYDISQFTLA